MSTDAEFFCLDLARLPDELYNIETPAKEWQQHVKAAGKAGFPAGSLSDVAPIPLRSLIERTIVFPIYMFLNAAPMMVPPALYLFFGLKGVFVFLAALTGLHMLFVVVDPMKSAERGQYLYTERNIQKYNSIKLVWPKSLQPPNLPGPKLFCIIPHGLAPIGITAYPFWSKMFGGQLCHWSGAPIVLKLPVVSYFLKRVGAIAAESKEIKRVLTNKEEHVGVVLDGIAGMFQNDSNAERAWILQRKGIVKIALTTGTPIVPVYGFGHSSMWRILVDPFGILERISLALNVSVVPFCGRPFGLLPFGPPYRTPVLVAIGDPVVVPKVETPTQEQIDEYHGKLLEGFQHAFDRHKAAYGWPEKKLKMV